MNQPLSAPSSRRHVLAGAAVAATLLGAGVAWWRLQGDGRLGGAEVHEPVAGFWASQWATPVGGIVPMATFKGRPLLINFWATWCPPCVEELPLINDFYLKNKAAGWQVLGLAVDGASAVNQFLEKMPLAFPVALAALGGVELGRNLGNLTGGLPFSVALAADGQVLQRKMGRLTAVDLAAWAAIK
jgi:thiol-disulfide isomerase/thioredoxin